MRKIGGSTSNRHIRPQGEASVKAFYVDLLDIRVLNVETKKKVMKIKAGGEYLLHLGTIKPRACILHCKVNQDIIDSGFCNWTERTVTPMDNDKAVKFIVRLKAAADLDVKTLDHGVRILMEEGVYSRWI